MSQESVAAAPVRPAMQFKKVAVVGGGQMGNGIAHVFALAGCSVTIVDVSDEAAKKGVSIISANLERQVAKGLDASAAKAAAARLIPSGAVDGAKDAELVVEAVPENLELKRGIFSKLDALCPASTILATNTSSLPIFQIAAATKRPDKVIGMHFMNPVPVMKLVEIIRGKETSEATYRAVDAAARALGKVPACSKDVPGFIANRILMPMINEAVWALHQGVATKEDIDVTMKLGMNHPMGPLALADFIGLDTCLSIAEVLYDGFKEEKYKPCPLLKELVAEGRLGKKSGRGFYDWTEKK